MKKNQRLEYLVQVTIIEVRDLKGKDKSGTCDPFIKITVGNLPPQVTTTRTAANTAVFNQSFTFTGLHMNTIEFEQFEIKIECFDLKQFGSNQLVGIYSVGISTLYRNPGHEIFNKWLSLNDQKAGVEPQGFLLASAYVISPTDRPPVHDINENNVEEEPDEFGGVPDDQLDPEQLKRRLDKKNQIAIVSKPEIRGKSYQLMVNLVKAEDLPLMGYGGLDSFVSVRAGGFTQITATMKNQQKPQYLARLMFPLHFPFFNDKIVIRVWDKRSCMSDTYITTIPEIPSENDFFNINFLQSKGGVMPFRWLNLYGIPFDERPSNFEKTFFKYKQSIVGTDYMGRLLISLNLSQSEKPELSIVPLTTQREPSIDRYILRIDAYEIQEAKDCGEQVQVYFRIGGFLLRSESAFIKPEKVSKYKNQKEQPKQENKQGITYIWQDKKIPFDQERLELPQDKQQIPDMIISLYNEKKKRVAYIRIPYVSQDLNVNRPKWYTFKSVKQSDNYDVPHSFFLVNIMLRPESFFTASMPRLIVKRDLTQRYQLDACFYAGYDLCPDCYSEETMVTFSMKIGAEYIKLEDNEIKKGKNPIWNKRFQLLVIIDMNLEFASNIIIHFQNVDPSKNKWYQNNEVGSIVLSPLQCKYDDDNMEPQYNFYHIQREGNSAGRILAAFKLKKINKDQGKDLKRVQPLFEEDKFEHQIVQLPIFGVRNLKTKMKDPQIIVKVPIPDGDYNIDNDIKLVEAQQFQLENDTSWFGGGILDPNFLKVVNLEVHLPTISLIFYPQVEVELFDAKNKNERYICSIPLVDYLSNTQIDPLEIDQAKKFFENGKKFEIQDNEGIMEDLTEQDATVQQHKPDINEIKADGKISHKQSAKPSLRQTQLKKPIEENKDHHDPDHQDKDKTFKEKQTEKQTYKSSVTSNNDNSTKASSVINETLLTKGILNVEVNDMEDLIMNKEDLVEVKKLNKQKQSRLLQLLKAQPKTYKYKDQLKLQVKREVEKLKSATNISEKTFMKQANEPDEGEGFDYGRDVLKGPYEDELAKNIPFKRFPLYRLSSSKYGVIGNPTDAVIKGDVKIIPKPLKSVSQSKNTKKSRKTKKNVQMNLNQKLEYKFNIFEQDFLDYFRTPIKLKVRLYILRCLNLAAQSQNIDMYHKMAGLDAICSADSYPEIFIGQSTQDNQDLIKHITDQDRPILNTLSPNFFRMYELDAELPTDWKLMLHIKNKSMFDSTIGSIQIDIEDRIVGEEKLKQRIAHTVYRDRYVMDSESDIVKYDDTAYGEKYRNFLNGQITNLTQLIENFDKKFSVPVEYKDLKIEGRNQASQGTVEMFLEVLPTDLAREIEPAPLNPPVPQEYEVRLIIWETFEIPKIATKKVVDIMLRVAMDPTATGIDKEVAKETDVHNGSENGDGSFSYRMKFPLMIPCSFPRLKMTVYDFSPFGTNENLGEATISLRPILNRLKRDGKFEMEPTRVKLSHPNFPGQNRGQVLIQMDILTKPAADGQPVGDAQDEPNVNPYLVKPTEGRGLADFFKGAGFGMGNFMLYVKIFAGLFVTVLAVMILFVKPGILVN